MIHHMRSITLLTNVEPNTVFNASFDSIISALTSPMRTVSLYKISIIFSIGISGGGGANPYDSQF